MMVVVMVVVIIALLPSPYLPEWGKKDPCYLPLELS